MDTSNRQEGGSHDDRVVTLKLSERVAALTNLEKAEVSDLSPKEWVEVIKVALAHVKTYFNYIPYFRPTSGLSFQAFELHLNGSRFLEAFWREVSLSVEPTSFGPILHPRVSAFLESRTKALEVFCLHAHVSQRIMLNSEGVFVAVICHSPHSSVEPTIIDDVQVILGDEGLEKLFTLDSRIGHSTLFAISSALSETYRKKIMDLSRLRHAGDKVRGICNNFRVNDMPYIHPSFCP